jgi:hypothetical protein
LDRARRRPGGLIAALGLLGLGLALAAAAPPPVPLLRAPPLRSLRWLAPGVDASMALTRRPTECLTLPADAETAYEVELGRAAFRTPLVLGGQAARAGIDCETCHRNGRGNPEFDFPGVSGAPGTADVTTPVLSSHLDDGALNPRPIPNLSSPKSELTTPQDVGSGALEARIAEIDTQEFDGPPPPPAVLTGLAAYVRALSPAACPAAATEPMTAAGALADVRRAVLAAIAALDHGDGPAATVMIEAARSQLGDIDERYAGAVLAPVRHSLELTAGDLAGAAAETRRDAGAARTDLVVWLADEPRWSPQVTAAEPASLYNPARLAVATALTRP